MKDPGKAKKILGMNALRDRNNNTLKIHQKVYMEKILVKFSIQNSKLVAMPLAGLFKLDDKLNLITNE